MVADLDVLRRRGVHNGPDQRASLVQAHDTTPPAVSRAKTNRQQGEPNNNTANVESLTTCVP